LAAVVTLEYVVVVMKSEIPILCGLLGFNSVLQSDQLDCCEYGSSMFIQNIGTQLPGDSTISLGWKTMK
jgi:hypothetical protein